MRFNKNYPYRWGIMASGHIAGRFAEGMASLKGDYVLGIASRQLDKAQAFADRYKIPRAYGTYQDLAQDPEIDIIYIASPHPFHHPHTLLALEAGKHVLCEKPLAVNLHQGQEMKEMAQKKGVFLMEGIWTRFLPVMKEIRSWLKQGKIGEPRILKAGFNFRANSFDPNSRLFNPQLGGGALLDIGIYPIMLAYMIFGEPPLEIRSLANMGPTGVDHQSTYIFKYANGELASLSAGFEASGSMDAAIIGTEGEIRIPIFWKGSQALLQYPKEDANNFDFTFQSSGLQYQALHLMYCLENGLSESPIMPLSQSLQILDTMDRIRKSWGLSYPFE